MRALASFTLFIGIYFGFRAYISSTFNDVMRKAIDPKSTAFKMPTTYTPPVDFTKIQKFNVPTINPANFRYVPPPPPRINIPTPPSMPRHR